MSFVEAPRIRYGKNPLIQVVCQLRFPRILKINESMPVQYQDAIRDDYPLFNITTEQQQQFLFESNNEAINPTPKLIQSDPIKNYRFSSKDDAWHINLTNTFIAISTSEYTCWEEFLSKFSSPLSALVQVYSPAYFERVGLRYIDAFQRSKLGLNGVDWYDLIEPFALGFLSNKAICDDIKNHENSTEISIGDNSIVKVRTSLSYLNNRNQLQPYEGQEICFIIDSDFFTTKIDLNQLDVTLEKLHSNSTNLLRAIITDRLHEAMEPELI